MSSYEIVGLTEDDMALCVAALWGRDSKAQVRPACELCDGTKQTYPAGSFEPKPCPKCSTMNRRRDEVNR